MNRTCSILILGFGAMVMLTGCGGFIYVIDVVNYGQSGVVIMEMSHRQSFVREPYITKSMSGKEAINDPRIPGLESLAYVSRIYPSIPSKYRNPANAFGRFSGYQNSLPREVEVIWKLAELKDCEREVGIQSQEVWREVKSRGYDPGNHVSKNRCTWSPIVDRVYRQRLNMAAIRNSEEYKKVVRGGPHWFSSNRLNLTLEFNEDNLTVKVQRFVINSWK